MIRLDHTSLQMMTGGAQIIEADAHGTKVLLLPDGSYLKFFRRKRLFSSALWSPYAQRFADNCRALATHRIPCPEVIALYRITSIARDAVHYYPLPGQTLRSLLQQGIDEAEAVRLRRQLGNFVARLHILGIYFRSLHLGNIVRTPQDALGLIDLADIRIHRRGLDRFHRQRNLKHLSRYPEEAQWLSAQGDFSVAYHAGIAPTGKNAIWL